MFKIPSVELTNFRSFVGTHLWVLNERPGLYFLTGINNENPRLGRNGIGKSTLLDAISWCNYGRTTRGIRANDVISRGKDTAAVSVKHIVNEDEFTVTRTQNPNSLKIDGKIVTQDELTKRLRLNYESFLYSIIIPQAGNSFLDLSPGQKLTLFSQIMDLDFWLEKSAEAAEESKRIEIKKEEIERHIARLNGHLSAIQTNIEELKLKSKEFEKKKNERIEHLTEELTKTSIETDRLNFEFKKLERSILQLAPQINEAEDKVSSHERGISDLDKELIEADKELALIEHEISLAKESESRLKRIGGFCSACKQKVDEKHLQKELDKINHDLNELNSFKSDLKFLKNGINSKKSDVTIKISTHETALINLRAEESKAKNSQNRLTSEISYLEREGIKLGLEIKKTKDLTNDFAEMVTRKNNELSSLNKEIETKKEEIARLNEDYAAVHYWVSGFKQLRLFIIEEALTSLEIEVNNNLAALGLGDWKIQFDIERENKSGGITKGFTTMITDPQGFTAPYETMSFGETQRIKLAGAFGLANLIVERAGLSSKIQFYDEPSVHMSPEGIEDTLNALRDMANNYEREVWIIDHNALAYADFVETISIIKDENGSRFA